MDRLTKKDGERYYLNGATQIGLISNPDGNEIYEELLFKGLEKLGKIEDLEDEVGIKLVELHNLVGKNVYMIHPNKMKVIPTKVDSITFKKGFSFIITKIEDFFISEFNVNWFIDEKLAQKKLGELK